MIGRVALAVLCAAACPAQALAAPDLSGEFGLVSDYRDRGLSLSRGKPAAQASALVEDESGFYAEAWGSTLGAGLDAELDFSVGYAAELPAGVTTDTYLTYVAYPGDAEFNYFEATGAATLSRGGASGTLGASYVPAQSATRANLYLFAQAAYAVPATPLTVTARLGHESGAFDDVEHGAKRDWSLAAEAEVSAARLGIAYVGSNGDSGARHALVGTLAWGW